MTRIPKGIKQSYNKDSQIRKLFDTRAPFFNSEASWVNSGPAVNLMIQDLADGVTVLDCCGGVGILSEILTENQCNAALLDLSFDSLMRAPPQLRKVQAHALQMPFANNSFDWCLLRQALHYLDPEPGLIECCRVVSSGVRIANVVMDLPSDREFFRGYAEIVTPGRTKFFERGEISLHLRRAGFGVPESQTWWDSTFVDGSITHLKDLIQENVFHYFEAQPESIIKRYQIHRSADGSLAYRVPWEFHEARVL